VHLIVVTKTFPTSDIVDLVELGVRDIGESRDQEARVKAQELAGATPPDLRWHFIGQLQTNKAKSVATYADFVHSVDRAGLVQALAKGAVAAGREVGALIQVNLDGQAAAASGVTAATERDGTTPATERGGTTAQETLELAEQVERSGGLRLSGVMGVAPLDQPPAPAFEHLAEVARQARAAHPSASMISAGMSDDMVEAIAAGATHVRIGSKVLGFRPPIR
jgi:pyridoxal phosphate enzyme (YggS family)